MPKLPRTSGAAVVRALERLGFVSVRQRGSHVVLRKETEDGAVGTSVPRHDQLAVGTLAGILRQAQVTPEEFIANL